MDLRERLLQDFKNAMISRNYDVSEIDDISNMLLIKLDMYELSERCTDVAIRDNSSEGLLKIYSGVLLTEGKSRKTVYGYTHLLTRFLNDVQKPFTEVNVMDIRVWLAKMQSTVSLRTCENYRAYLSAFYQWLTNEEIIDKNPTSKILPIKYPEETKKPFTDVEIDKLRNACTSLRERAEIEMLISTGARVSEICAMNISDIDLESHDVLIREGKGNKQRITYINEVCAYHLRKYLESRTDNKPYLFISRNSTRLTKNACEADLKKIGIAAGVEKVHPHKCRRTFATTMSKKGMDVTTIQKLLGHSNINTTTIYLSLSDQHSKNEYMRCN